MRPTRTRNDPLKSLVGFFVGDVPYAIEIGRVVQIVNPLPFAALPHLPLGVAGVADYRGDVLAVIDLRARFGVPVTASARTKWIVVNVGGPCAAVVVDRVAEVFGTKGAELRPAPGLGGEDLRGILGVTSHDGALIFVLDVTRLRPLVDAASPLRGSMHPVVASRPPAPGPPPSGPSGGRT